MKMPHCNQRRVISLQYCGYSLSNEQCNRYIRPWSLGSWKLSIIYKFSIFMWRIKNNCRMISYHRNIYISDSNVGMRMETILIGKPQQKQYHFGSLILKGAIKTLMGYEKLNSLSLGVGVKTRALYRFAIYRLYQ